jgi:hypothetical protein
MTFLKNFGLFWYDFIIGDDWTVAVAVVVALTLVGVLAHQHVAIWWLLPLVVLAFLGISLKRAVDRA